MRLSIAERGHRHAKRLITLSLYRGVVMGLDASSLRPLVLAAITLVGGYETSEAAISSSPAPHGRPHHDTDSMQVILAELIAGWGGLEQACAQRLRQTLDTDRFDEETFSSIGQYLNLVRGLELTLKAVAAPPDLASQHLQLRKAVANARSRLAELDHLYRQTRPDGEYIDTGIDLNGLRALAELTTSQLGRRV